MQDQRIDGIDGAQAAAAVETFADTLSRAPGVWAVTVKQCRIGSHGFDLHLIVHGDITDADEELFGASGWWTC